MFDIYITREVNDYLRSIEKELIKKGYKKSISRTKRHLGNGCLFINTLTKYYIKGKMIFEIEKDLINNSICIFWHYERQLKKIQIGSILDLA